MNTNEIKFRFAVEEDSKGILNLLNSVFAENQRSTFERGDEYWKWKFTDNVLGISIITLAEHDNKIVGIDHLWPWELHCRGMSLKAYQPCDSAVSTNYRRKGIFQELRERGIKEAIRKGGDLLFNFPNKSSLPANLNLGAVYLGKISWWVKILRPVNIVKGFLKNSDEEYVELNETFKIDFKVIEDLAHSAKKYDGYIKTNRIDGFHQWRYGRHPSRTYGMVIGSNGNEQTAAIFTLIQDTGKREMVIVDIIGSPENTVSLFREVNKVGKELKADFIAVMDNPHFMTNDLWKLGYFRKKLKNMVVLPFSLAIENKVTDFDNWSLMAGMHDSI